MKKSELAYDDLPYNLKEDIGFPTKYFNLTIEQKCFIDAIYRNLPVKDTNKVLSKIKEIHSAIEDIDYSLATIEEEMNDRA